MSRHEPIGLQIAVVRRRIKQVVAAIAAPHGLSVQQFWTIVALAENEGIALRDLAERQRIDHPTASRVIAALARKRLVRVGADREDRRRARLMLTPTGRELATTLMPLAEDVRRAIGRDLSSEERAALTELLHKVAASLDRYAEEKLGTLVVPGETA